MATISDYVNVIITQGARPIDTAGFGSVLFQADTVPAAFTAAPERTRTYASTAEMVSDGFATTDPAYLFAEKLFGQPQRPNEVIIGKSLVGDANITATLNAIIAETNDWFFLGVETRASDAATTTDLVSVASFAQANDKMFFVTASLASTTAATATNPAEQFQTASYDNTQVFVVADAEYSKYHEGALVGAMAATNPGTSTWFAKTLVGVPTSNFTTSEETTIQNLNANFYPSVAGVGFYTDGKQSGGSFGDTIRFSLWLKARIGEAVFGLMKRKSDLGLKIPYSETGFAMIKGAIQGDVVDLGISRGAILTALDGAPDPVITTPARADIPANDIANRVLPDVVVEVYFSGAVQQVTIRAYVLV